MYLRHSSPPWCLLSYVDRELYRESRKFPSRTAGDLPKLHPGLSKWEGAPCQIVELPTSLSILSLILSRCSLAGGAVFAA